MAKRKELLEKHPYKIGQGKDGKWRTYIPDKESGRKMIKRNTQKAVEDVVVNYYKLKKERETPKSFNDVYQHWRTVQDLLISANSIVKYNSDYKRYFENTDFAKKSIEKITEEDVKVFIVDTVKCNDK